MKVKALINLGTNDYPACPLKEGEIGEVSETLGLVMIARRHAVEVPVPVQPKPVPLPPGPEPAPTVKAAEPKPQPTPKATEPPAKKTSK